MPVIKICISWIIITFIPCDLRNSLYAVLNACPITMATSLGWKRILMIRKVTWYLHQQFLKYDNSTSGAFLVMLEDCDGPLLLMNFRYQLHKRRFLMDEWLNPPANKKISKHLIIIEKSQRPGSNRGPCACEAHVITTTLRWLGRQTHISHTLVFLSAMIRSLTLIFKSISILGWLSPWDSYC